MLDSEFAGVTGEPGSIPPQGESHIYGPNRYGSTFGVALVQFDMQEYIPKTSA